MLHRTCALLPVAFALSVFSATGGATTAQRTFVASTGNDANPCSLLQPCRGFARAITQTSSGGEVIVLDSAGYGAVTITQSISIVAAPGIYAGISVFSGDGVSINSAGIRVVLRGLTITGLGGSTGINVTAADDVEVSSCAVSGMAFAGLAWSAAGNLNVGDSVFDHNSYGINQQQGNSTFVRVIIRENLIQGFLLGFSTVTLSASTIERNGQGGLYTDAASYVTVRDTSILGNAGNGVRLHDGYLRVSTSIITVNDSYGVTVDGVGQAWLVDNTIYDNVQNGPGNSEVCACEAGTSIYLSGNAISSAGATYIVDGSVGSVASYGNNALNGVINGILGTHLLR